MNIFNKILSCVLCFSIVIQWLPNTYAQEISQAKTAIQSYIDSWLNSDQENWLLEVNDIKIPSYGIEKGLISLEENLNNASLSRTEKQQVINRFVKTYIDQSTVLGLSYQEFIDNPQLDLLLQEFLRQAATQMWLESKIEKDTSVIVPTEDEINAYYAQNSERLLRLGLSAAQIKEYTEQELRQQKIQQWTSQQLSSVSSENNVIINPKFKEKYGI